SIISLLILSIFYSFITSFLSFCNIINATHMLSFSLICLPPLYTIFPYTTLFRSGDDEVGNRPSGTLGRCCANRQEHGRISRGLRSEEHTSELQSRFDLVCRLLLEKKKT